MKSRETLIRLKKFQVDEKRRRVTQIEGMIADFQRMSVDLEREIQTEQDRAGINDPSHFAYPTYAKAAIQRRENLTRSADELRIQLEDAKSLLSEAFEELKKVELLDERDQARERAEESAREQADMDSIGLMRPAWSPSQDAPDPDCSRVAYAPGPEGPLAVHKPAACGPYRQGMLPGQRRSGRREGGSHWGREC
jgi:flagellar export protein FliJ